MSSRKNRRHEVRAAKQRRQKQIAIGGGVVLAILLAVQVPRLMHGGGSSTAATATTTTAGSETTTAATSTTATSTLGDVTSTAPAAATGAGATAGVPTTHTKLPDSDVAPTRLRTQLASFELFDSKDPFVQQVSDEAPPTAAGGTASMGQAPAAAPTGSGTTTPPGTAPSATQPTATQPPATARTLAHSLDALIEVNGKSERVGVDQAFPASRPTFKLVSLANGVAMIGIAQGAYASGAQTIALQLGKTLTLVDTTDGVRYQLRLVSTS